MSALREIQSQGLLDALYNIGALLLEHRGLKEPFRSAISEVLKQSLPGWVEVVKECIRLREPFQLSYQDAAGRIWKYTVRHARLAFREKRNYLEIWSEETEGNQDLPELQHNWSLRLDRIFDAGVVPIEGEWREALDTLEVEFDLFGGLANAYQQRDNDDIAVRWIGADPPTLRVTRRISNTFWFIREVLRYGKDCVVLEPEAVRQKIREQLQAACDRYVTRRDEH